MIKPNSKAFAITRIPDEEDVPKIFGKKLSCKMDESINVVLSRIEYKLLSIDENKLPKSELIVSAIICVICEADICINSPRPLLTLL